MSIIKGFSNFKIKITPRYSNWWSFDLEFLYKEKPVINPEILRSSVFSSDEYKEGSFLSFLEQIIECKEDNQYLSWNSWEDEVDIQVYSHMKNFDKGTDGGFDFSFFISEEFFEGGNQHYGFQDVGIKLSVDREGVKKLYEDLKKEMSEIAKKTIEELSQRNDKGYDDHVTLLKKFVGKEKLPE